MNRIGDRHKGTNRPSGSQKRKLSKEKASQDEKDTSHRITAFLQATAISTSPVTVDDGQNAGSSEPGVTGDAVVVVKNRQFNNVPSRPGLRQKFCYGNYKLDCVNNNMKIENALAGDIVQDIGLWPEHLTQEVINYWAKNGSTCLQHCDSKVLMQHSVC